MSRPGKGMASTGGKIRVLAFWSEGYISNEQGNPFIASKEHVYHPILNIRVSAVRITLKLERFKSSIPYDVLSSRQRPLTARPIRNYSTHISSHEQRRRQS
jgi:hypothetical protein